MPECLGRMAGVFLEKPDKIGGVLITQVVGYVFYLVGGGEQVFFGFQNDVFIDQFGSGFADARFGDFIELISGKVHHFRVLRYLLAGGKVLLQQFQEVFKSFLGIRIGLGCFAPGVGALARNFNKEYIKTCFYNVAVALFPGGVFMEHGRQQHLEFVKPAFLRHTMIFVAGLSQTLVGQFALGMIKLGVELEQKSGATGVQFKLVYLSGAQKENSMVLHRIVNKIYLMAAISILDGQYKKEVVPVQVMYQITSTQNIL